MSDNTIDSIVQVIMDMPPDHKIDFLLNFAERLGDERDRYRAGLELIATPPVHIPNVSEGCEGCAGIARAALDGKDFTGPISETLERVDVTLRVLGAVQRWYRAGDVEELAHAAAGLKEAAKALNEVAP